LFLPSSMMAAAGCDPAWWGLAASINTTSAIHGLTFHKSRFGRNTSLHRLLVMVAPMQSKAAV
jgi:hypothetical protein